MIKKIITIILIAIISYTLPCFSTNIVRSAYCTFNVSDYDDIYDNNPEIYPIETSVPCVGNLLDGDYLMYKDVDFSNGVSEVSVDIGTVEGYCGVVEFHLDSFDGELIAALKVTPSGSWGTPLTHKTSTKKSPVGVHNLYLVVKEKTSNIFSFTFFPKTDKAQKYFAQRMPIFNDIANSAFEKEINLITDLNINDIYNDETFLLKNEVTRGEFAHLIANILSNNILADKEVYFKDTIDCAYKKDIDYLYKSSIITINKEKNFHPNDTITMNDAIVMCVRLLGYEPYAIGKGGYPTGYLIVASNEKITTGLLAGNVLTRENSLKLLHNVINAKSADIKSISSDVTIYEKDKKILERTQGIYTNRGEVTKTAHSSLKSPSSDLNDNEIEIDNQVFKVINNSLQNHLGKILEYYYKKVNDENIIIAFMDLSSKRKEIVTTEFYSDFQFKDNKITCYDKSQNKSVFSIDKNDVVLYNMKYIDFYFPDIFKNGFKGEIICETSYDNKKIINIKGYTNVKIGAINNKIIYDSLRGKEITISPNTRIEVYDNKKEINIYDLSLNDYATIYESKNQSGNKTIQIVKNTSKVSGTVGTIKDNTVFINDKCYNVDKNSNKEIHINLNADFIVNSYNEIMDFEKTNNSVLGCLLDYKENSSSTLDGSLKFKILTASNEIKTFISSNELFIDGIKHKNKTDSLNALSNIEKNLPIRYELDENEVIKFIDTPIKIKGDDKDTFKKISQNTVEIYRRGNMLLWWGRPYYPLTTDAKMLNLYSGGDETRFTFENTVEALPYDLPSRVDLYTTDENSSISNLVVWKDRISTIWSEPITFDKITDSTLSPSNESVKKLYGYMGNKLVSYTINKEWYEKSDDAVKLFSSLEKGDVLTYQLTDKNEIYNYSIKFLSNATGKTSSGIEGGLHTKFCFFTGDLSQENNYSLGYVTEKKDGYVIADIPEYMPPITNNSVPGFYFTEYINTANTKVLRYDDENSNITLTPTNVSDISPNDKILIWYSYGVPRQIWIFNTERFTIHKKS